MTRKLCPFLAKPCDPDCMFFMVQTEEECLIKKSLEEVYTHKTLSRIQVLTEGIKREL
ncbi:MAG: hypothetical protein P4L59_00385 [Desulfosporosinus sp.]|nr:hypothetical protein [Desulfosporosinus sp.]